VATSEDYAAWIVANAAKKGTPEFDIVAKAYADSMANGSAQLAADRKLHDPSKGGGTFQFGPIDTGLQTPEFVDRTLSGIGKGMSDLARGASQRLGIIDTPDVAETRRLDAPLMNTTAGKVGNVTGKVAATLPAVFVPGANTYAGAALVGGGMGALEPTVEGESVAKNIGVGAAAGAIGQGAGRLLGAGYRALKSSAEPFYQAGRDAILGRTLLGAAGDDAPNVLQRLVQSSTPVAGPFQPGMARQTVGELVPGSAPTAAQAAESPGIAAMARAANANNPTVTNAVAERAAQQNAARVAQLESMSGAGGSREFAAANRDATAEQLFGDAYRAGFGKLTPAQLQNVAQFQQRVPAEVLNEAKKIAQVSGQPMTDATSLQGMHWTKKALDGLIAKESGPGGNSALLRAYVGLKNDMMQGLSNLSPEYGAASRVYAEMSRPVNQMEVAAAIADKSINPLTGTLQPAAYARNLSDQTAKRATGFQGATIENTMENQQANMLQSILADVRRQEAAANAGRGVGSDTVQKLAYTNMLDRSGVPTFLREFAPAQIVGNLAGRGADVAYGRANRELSTQLAELLQTPEGAAAVMQAAQQGALPNALQRLAANPYMRLLQTTTPAASTSR
jgi:hypothetical protein